jgi:hypothetical protein
MVALQLAHDVQHDVLLRGPFASPGGAPGPVIVARSDEDFLPALLAELGELDAATVLERDRVKPRGSTDELRLFQPVHRVFNIAVLEASCTTFMEPRLDPRRIVSSGLVVRRVCVKDGQLERDAQGRYVCEGWRSRGKHVAGWVRFPYGNVAADADPLPEQRTVPRVTGALELDQKLAPRAIAYTEHTSGLFVAPPAVHAHTKRTLFYGVVPVTSNSRAPRPDPLESRRPEDLEAFRGHLSFLLKAGDERTVAWRQTLTLVPPRGEPLSSLPFVLLVKQLGQEMRAFDDTIEAKAIRAQLDKILVTLADGSVRPAGDYLLAASRVLLEGKRSSKPLFAPMRWSAISSALAADIEHALLASVDASLSKLVAAPGRFDEEGRHYVVRAFVRLKTHPGCPPKLVWSELSAPFQILPWYARSPVPATQIKLPDVSEAIKASPGVAFAVPRKLFNLLRGDPQELLKGNGSEDGFELDWVCGFSIPIITICAFILLNIILVIMHLIFWWLPFVKVCFPLPRKRAS